MFKYRRPNALSRTAVIYENNYNTIDILMTSINVKLQNVESDREQITKN